MTLSKNQPAGQRLLDALGEFEAKPGRYSLVMREPGVLFDQTRNILMLALGRALPELQIDSARAEQVQASAKFFVRMALFRNGADHYTTLGLWPGFAETELRDHYRLLMRLTHPDFVAGDQSWPIDAATRVNRAYEVLSSIVKKSEYDRSLHQRPQHIPVSPRHMRPHVSYADARDSYSRWSATSVWVGIGIACAVMLGAWASLHDWRDEVEVVSLNMDNLPPVRSPARAEPVPVLAAPSSAPIATSTPEPAVLPASAVVAVQLPATVESLPAPVIDRVVESNSQLTAADSKARRKKERQEAREREEREREASKRLARAQAQVARLAAEQPRVVSGSGVRPVMVAAAVPQEASPVRPDLLPARPPVVVAAPVAVADAKPAELPLPRLGVADAQPIVVTILQGMQTGNPDAITHSLDRHVRSSESAVHLTRVYRHLVGNSSDIKVGQVQLRGKHDGEQLVVDGVVRLHLLDQGQPAPVRELRMRAVFVRQGAQVALIQLSAGS